MTEWRDVTALRAWVAEHIAERPYGPQEEILAQIDAAPELRDGFHYREGFREGARYARDIDRVIDEAGVHDVPTDSRQPYGSDGP